MKTTVGQEILMRWGTGQRHIRRMTMEAPKLDKHDIKLLRSLTKKWQFMKTSAQGTRLHALIVSGYVENDLRLFAQRAMTGPKGGVMNTWKEAFRITDRGIEFRKTLPE